MFTQSASRSCLFVNAGWTGSIGEPGISGGHGDERVIAAE